MNLIWYTLSQLPAVHLQKHCYVQQNHRPGTAFIPRHNIWEKEQETQKSNKHKTSKDTKSNKHKTSYKHKGTIQSDFVCIWEKRYRKLNERDDITKKETRVLMYVNPFTARSDTSTAVIFLLSLSYTRILERLWN